MPVVEIKKEVYDYPSGKGIDETVKEMERCSIEELRLWIIQELSASDSDCWWLIDIGVAKLKEKMKKQHG